MIFFLFLKYKKKNSLISLLSFFLIFIVVFSQHFFSEFNKLFLVTFFSGIFLLFYNEKNYLSFFFNNKQFIYFGNISYSFYLWHLPVIYFYDLYYISSFIRIPVILILTFTISSISYKYIEQKFRYYDFNKIYIKRYSSILVSSILIFLFSFYFISQKTSYDGNLKKNIKSLIVKFNYLEQKFNYSNRAIFYKHHIGGNQIYRFCEENSKDYSLNFLNLRNECLKNNTTEKIFFLEGNSHTANFVTMFENSKFIKNFYYSHVADINFDDLVNNKKINKLSEKFDKFFYVTAANNMYELNSLKQKLKYFNNNVNILIIGPIPNFSEDKIKILECFIKQIDCSFDTTSDIKSKEIIISEIEQLAQSDKIFFYNPYKGLCPKKICYTYNMAKDLLTHRDDTHLTIEGSKLLVPHFYNYHKNYLN